MGYSAVFFTQNSAFFQENNIKVIDNGDTLINAWTGGFNAVQISKIDLNNDQIEDLFVFDRTGNKISTFITNGNKYIYDPHYEQFFPNELTDWVLLRDFNGDNKKDIFGSVSAGIGVWKNVSNDGEINFEKQSFFHPGLNSQVFYLLSEQYNNKTNIYVTGSDLPDINDIDSDGDLDILTFGVLGTRLEYHKNNSVELGYGKDSLIFELKNNCWGHFTEAGLTNTCFLFDTCASNVSNPESPLSNDRNQIKHAGSTVLSLNLNDDEVKDLILGDVSFSNLVALYNDNKGVNMNTSFIFQDTSFPNNSIPTDLYLFPGAFYEDFNNDGVKDLIVSPNSDNETMDKESIWYYENAGSNSSPNFYLQNKNILQETTIEVGRAAKPIFVDINNDQVKDLLIANFGEFDLSVPIHYHSSIISYINTGTNNSPEFTKSSSNFQNLSNLIGEINLQPTFGDLDNDGDLDAIIGDFSGELHYLENNPLSNGEMNLNLSVSPLSDQFNNIFDFGYCSHPVLFDIDQDNDLDIIVGEARGNLNYIENIGTNQIFNFDLVNEEFGGVNVSEWWTNIGSSAPLFSIENNETQLYVGSERGTIFKFNSISNNLTGNFSLIDSVFMGINDGPNSVIAFENLNNDTIPDMVIGNRRGGLSLYLSGEDISVNTIDENIGEFFIYPNPAKNILHINNHSEIEFKIYNLTGKLVKKTNAKNHIVINDLDHGIYFLSFQHKNQTFALKFIK
jgi:hypothetical protein